MLHIWHEDKCDSSHQRFWTTIVALGLDARLVGADVQGFDGNLNLEHALRNIVPSDKYMVLCDAPLHNPVAYQTYMRIALRFESFTNVSVVALVSSECLWLSFKYFRQFFEKPGSPVFDILNIVRLEFLDYLHSKNDDYNSYKALVLFISDHPSVCIDGVASEERIADLLLRLLSQDFGKSKRIDKSSIGNCWLSACCCCMPYQEHAAPLCNLYGNSGFTSTYKFEQFYRYSVAAEIVNRVLMG